jgi:DNA-binding LacI/PurR family transcriptional regulator
MKRPTISDIAQRAGVTKAAVSFALNGRPGVSAATRERILAIADELGFQPSSAARSLTAGRAGAFGLVAVRPDRALDLEPVFLQLLSGIAAELAGRQDTLLFAVAGDTDAEIEQYRRWWAQRRVDGVLLTGLQVNDRRVPVLEQLRLPAVVIGPPRGAGSLPAVWPDDRAAAEVVTGYLAAQGHRRIARVGDGARYWHSVLRRDAFTAAAAAAGLTAFSVAADDGAGPGAERGAQATTGLLGAAEPPTAIVYDSDVLAAAGLAAAQRAGVRVPGQVSLVSWDDSALCELLYPALSALRRDIAGTGVTATRMLGELVAGGHPESVLADPPVLQTRMSSGPADAGGLAARSRRTA